MINIDGSFGEGSGQILRTSPEHLADQLLLPFVLAGSGSFRAVALSKHFTTNVAVIRKFLDVGIKTTREDRLNWLVKIKR